MIGFPQLINNKIESMPKEEYYTWKQFDKDVARMVKRLRKHKKKFNGVWGPPRGGLPLAVVISHALGIPFLSKYKGRKTLVVDDIADTGKTLYKYADKNFIATLFYHRQSKYVPNVWIREKGKKWIIFPWERKV